MAEREPQLFEVTFRESMLVTEHVMATNRAEALHRVRDLCEGTRVEMDVDECRAPTCFKVTKVPRNLP